MENFIKEFTQGGIAVHCKNKKEADEFRGIVEKYSRVNWATGTVPTEFDPYFIYEEETCFEVVDGKLFYCEIGYFETRHYKIVKFPDIEGAC